MVELHQELQRIEEHLSLVTRMLHVVAELVESFDANEEYDQGTADTDPGLMDTYFPQNAPQVESQHFCPIPHRPASDDTRPQVGPSVPQSEMLHFNLSAISDSITVLRSLTGVFKVGHIEINHHVAENIKKVLAHRLDKEMRAKVEADVRILSGYKCWNETLKSTNKYPQLSKGMTRACTLVPDDKKFMMTLNVKEPNKYVLSSQFKMKTLDTCPPVDAKQLIHDQFRFKGHLFYASYS